MYNAAAAQQAAPAKLTPLAPEANQPSPWSTVKYGSGRGPAPV
eukprot:gene6325-3311_t